MKNPTKGIATFQSQSAELELDPTKLFGFISDLSSYLTNESDLQMIRNRGRHKPEARLVEDRGQLCIQTEVLEDGFLKPRDLGALVLGEDGRLQLKINAHNNYTINPYFLIEIGKRYQLKS